MEMKWVQAVQNSGDSHALELLVHKYQPMIRAAAQRYYLRLFDDDDWQQEARIVCYQTCLLYQDQYHCQFGAFFKLRFDHHVRSLLRHELALKRRIDQQSISWETTTVSEPVAPFDAGIRDPELAGFDFPAFLASLSYFELQAFKVVTQQLSLEAACRQLNCEEQQLKRGMERCKLKLKAALS